MSETTFMGEPQALPLHRYQGPQGEEESRVIVSKKKLQRFDFKRNNVGKITIGRFGLALIQPVRVGPNGLHSSHPTSRSLENQTTIKLIDGKQI